MQGRIKIGEGVRMGKKQAIQYYDGAYERISVSKGTAEGALFRKLYVMVYNWNKTLPVVAPEKRYPLSAQEVHDIVKCLFVVHRAIVRVECEMAGIKLESPAYYEALEGRLSRGNGDGGDKSDNGDSKDKSDRGEIQVYPHYRLFLCYRWDMFHGVRDRDRHRSYFAKVWRSIGLSSVSREVTEVLEFQGIRSQEEILTRKGTKKVTTTVIPYYGKKFTVENRMSAGSTVRGRSKKETLYKSLSIEEKLERVRRGLTRSTPVYMDIPNIFRRLKYIWDSLTSEAGEAPSRDKPLVPSEILFIAQCMNINYRLTGISAMPFRQPLDPFRWFNVEALDDGIQRDSVVRVMQKLITWQSARIKKDYKVLEASRIYDEQMKNYQEMQAIISKQNEIAIRKRGATSHEALSYDTAGEVERKRVTAYRTSLDIQSHDVPYDSRYYDRLTAEQARTQGVQDSQGALTALTTSGKPLVYKVDGRKVQVPAGMVREEVIRLDSDSATPDGSLPVTGHVMRGVHSTQGMQDNPMLEALLAYRDETAGQEE